MTVKKLCEIADEIWETPLPAREFERLLALARKGLDGDEGAELRAQIEWFLRRYPEPLARLVYVRRKAREAARLRALADASDR